MNPMIFVSAVSAEFAQSRQLVVNVLTRLGYTPVFQEIFGTESGDLREVLRRKIDRCEGLIQIVGDGYGAEPPTVDSEFGRVSYTQFEFLYAAKKGLKTWVLEVVDGFPRDRPAAQLDLPPAGSTADPKEYQQERRELQKAYRATLKEGGHLRHKAADRTDLQLRMEQLRDELSELRAAFEQWKASLAGDVQNMPEAVARRLNPWAWVKRNKWAVGGVLVLLAALAVAGVLWQGANQRAAAEVAAAADDANRAWDQVKGTDRGQAVGGKLDATEAKLRSAGERSTRGDHAGAVADYHEAREMARGVIEADLFRRQAVAARTAYETSQKQVGNTFGASAAAEAASLFDTGDFPAATARWDAAGRLGEVGRVRKQLDDQLARYDVKRLEPLTPDLWKTFREAEAAANTAVESGNSELVQAKFADAKKALDAATLPARCREAFAVGYVGVMLMQHDDALARAAKFNAAWFEAARFGTRDDKWLADRKQDLSAAGLSALGLPTTLLGQLVRTGEATPEAVRRKVDTLVKLRKEVAAANGERVERWYHFGYMTAYVEYALFLRRGKIEGGLSTGPPDWPDAIADVMAFRQYAYYSRPPRPLQEAAEQVFQHHQNGKEGWYTKALEAVKRVAPVVLDDPDEAVRLIARDSPPPPTGDDMLMIRLGGSIDRSQQDKVIVRLDYSFVEDQYMGEVAGIAGMTDLHLGKTKVSNTGLAKLEGCDRLRMLNLWGTRIGPGASKSFQKMAALESIKMPNNQLPAAELDELRKALPKLNIDP